MNNPPGAHQLLGLNRPGWNLSPAVRSPSCPPAAEMDLSRGESDFGRMTDLARDFKTLGLPRCVPEIVSEGSADGTRSGCCACRGQGASKPSRRSSSRTARTLCISSQIGCALDCSFCATGQQGFNRNLSAAEIIGQVWLANRELGREPDGERIITNVVLMGMGEPLANYRNVLAAIQLMLDDLGYDLSRRRVTLSTSGLVPQIHRLAEDCNVALAVSLHAPNDRLRDQLVPINRKHPIAELLDACWHYLERQNGRCVTFEYTMLDGVNDMPAQARELAALLRGHDAKVNLIPFNTFPGTKYRRSPAATIQKFRDLLAQGGVMATVRRTRGDDGRACGQPGQVLDRTQVRLGSKLVRLAVQA
jgi:23S rRNA (adenine2503-C2)-methyltransferase